MRSQGRLFSLVAVICIFVMGCNSSESQHAGAIPTAKATPLATAGNESVSAAGSREPTTKLIGGIRFEIPANWEEKALASTVLLAEFSLPGPAGSGRLTLSTAGGGTSANMDRWKGQFQRGASDPEAKESQIRVAGKQAAMIEAYGTYADMFGGSGPKSNWQLLGVAIPIDSGHDYFVKLTGPKETVTACREEFLKFIESARFDQ
jgi:hypothetical protein